MGGAFATHRTHATSAHVVWDTAALDAGGGRGEVRTQLRDFPLPARQSVGSGSTACCARRRSFQSVPWCIARRCPGRFPRRRCRPRILHNFKRGNTTFYNKYAGALVICLKTRLSSSTGTQLPASSLLPNTHTHTHKTHTHSRLILPRRVAIPLDILEAVHTAKNIVGSGPPVQEMLDIGGDMSRSLDLMRRTEILI